MTKSVTKKCNDQEKETSNDNISILHKELKKSSALHKMTAENQNKLFSAICQLVSEKVNVLK